MFMKNCEYDCYGKSVLLHYRRSWLHKDLAKINSRHVIPSTKYFKETMLQQAYNSLKL